jgi:polyadenylate-binding protein
MSTNSTTTPAAQAEQYTGAQPTPASLYVGDLDPAVTEAVLFEVFNSVGTVASIRVCRDTVTRRSLGYGYVNFLNVVDAERAIESLNYAVIRNSPIRIMWSNRDPSIRKGGSGNIFIKNLDPSIDHKALHDTFSAFGNILSCKVAMEGESSKGHGFVHYETLEQAEAAIKAVNGMLLNDRQVFVGLHVSKKERESKLEEIKSKFTNVFVKNLDPSIDEDKLSEIFSEHGKITSIQLGKDENGVSKEFGFINFETHEGAALAVENLNGKEVNGKEIYVGRAQKKSEREEDLRRQYEKIREEKLAQHQGSELSETGVNLYVKNLDDSLDEEKLRQEFSAFGVITSCKIMCDEKTGLSKGFGFVCFSNPDEATKAVTEMNGRMLGQKPLYVALAQRKDARRAQLAAQIQQRNMRMQQAMIPGVPAGYPGQPMFYPPPQRGFYPGQPMMGRAGGFPGQGQMPARPFPAQGPPQGYPAQPMMPNARPARGRPNTVRGGAQAAVSAGRGRANFKYASNVRNHPEATPTLNLATLAAVPEPQQKQILGETLFPRVQAQAPVYAGKVTGMLLEMDNAELLHLLEDEEAFKSKVAEAVEALEAVQQE